MIYFLSFVGWLFLCFVEARILLDYFNNYGVLLFLRRLGVPSVFLSSTGAVLFYWFVTGIICLSVAIIYSRKRRPGLPAKLTNTSGLSVTEIKQRFPEHHIFRVPNGYLRNRYIHKYIHRSMIREDADWWDVLIKEFPTPPVDESDRRAREQKFWAMYLRNECLIDNGGGRFSLRPRQEILDHFERMEKWIFRYYYAATGVKRETIMKETIRLVHDRRTSDATRRNATIEAWSHFLRTTWPAHMEREGNWFFSNIEDAFHKLTAPAPTPAPNIYGDGGFASRADIGRVAGGVSPRANPRGAEHQTFDD